MLSDETQETVIHSLQQTLNRSLVDVAVYVDSASKDERLFFPVAMVFPYPEAIFEEHSTEGAYVLNQTISGFVKLLNQFVTEKYATPQEIVAVGIHDTLELVDDPPYYEAVCGNLVEDYCAMAIIIYVRFISSELRLMPYSFGLTGHKNEELEFIDYQLNKPTFNPEDKSDDFGKDF